MLTRSRVLCAAALCALAGSALASPWPLGLSKIAAPVRSEASAPAAPVAPRMALECVRGFSKDYCDGLVAPGTFAFSACPSPNPACKTVRISRSTYYMDMVSNRLACGDTSSTTCDESPDGRFKVLSDFTIRLQPSCPYRGCWESEIAEFTDSSGLVYHGTLQGTVGVGTHRLSGVTTCSTPPSTRNCERCYDVSFDTSSSLWRLGYEAAYHGTADTGEELCFSLSGDFYIRGDAVGGPIWNSTWTFTGTGDGTHLTFCP